MMRLLYRSTVRRNKVRRIVRRRVVRRRVGALGGPRAAYLLHKEAARVVVQNRLAHFNQHYKLAWGSVAIRNQKSRWGSCSKAKNLNFNYRIVFLPPHLQDYIIVHELCHLQEFNHSPKFWRLVGEIIPNPVLCKKELQHRSLAIWQKRYM